MTIAALGLFAATELALSLSPGPAVLLVTSQGIRAGARASLFGALGVIAGDLLLFAISALGLGVILFASQPLFVILKWTGAVYLVGLGAKLILTRTVTLARAAEVDMVVCHSTFLRQGFLMQLANPKAILFFTALLPQFISPSSPAAPQFLVLGAISVSIQFPTLLLYGWLADKGGKRFRGSKYARWVDRIAGVSLVGAGLKLALSRKA